jgi:hypothetical protein
MAVANVILDVILVVISRQSRSMATELTRLSSRIVK